MGKMGSGKSIVAEYLQNNYGYQILKFADPIYAIAKNDYGMTTKDIGLLQLIGNSGREIYPNIWIDIMLERLSEYIGKLVVVDDCRLNSELSALLSANFYPVTVISNTFDRLTRLADKGLFPTKEELNAITETDLDSMATNYKILLNMMTKEDLFVELEDLIHVV